MSGEDDQSRTPSGVRKPFPSPDSPRGRPSSRKAKISSVRWEPADTPSTDSSSADTSSTETRPVASNRTQPFGAESRSQTAQAGQHSEVEQGSEREPGGRGALTGSDRNTKKSTAAARPSARSGKRPGGKATKPVKAAAKPSSGSPSQGSAHTSEAGDGSKPRPSARRAGRKSPSAKASTKAKASGKKVSATKPAALEAASLNESAEQEHSAVDRSSPRSSRPLVTHEVPDTIPIPRGPEVAISETAGATLSQRDTEPVPAEDDHAGETIPVPPSFHQPELPNFDLRIDRDSVAYAESGATGDFARKTSDVDSADDDHQASTSVSTVPPGPGESLYEFERAVERYWDHGDDHEGRQRAAEAFAQVAAHLSGVSQDGMTSLVHPSHALRDRDETLDRDIDDFGLDRAYEESLRPYFDAMYHRWFRATARDLHKIPDTGRCVLVANHAGALPWDGMMLKTALRLEHPAHRELRWLAEDSVAHAPFLGALVNRLGAVRACPENAERLLQRESLVAVFPEGDKGMSKPYANRYQLQRFGRGGYVRLAIRTGAPIVPMAIVGSEETHPLLMRTRSLAKMVGLPFLPITPTFPWLGPFGLVPLPSRWVILCGDPIYVERDYHDPNDPGHVAQINDQVRGEVQSLVQRALRMRASAFS